MHNNVMNSENILELYYILPNPDKFDDSDVNNLFKTPHSNYYSNSDLGQLYNHNNSSLNENQLL